MCVWNNISIFYLKARNLNERMCVIVRETTETEVMVSPLCLMCGNK